MSPVVVVIPVHNGAATIAGQLRSLAGQDGIDAAEVLVGDNRSTDGTADRVREVADELGLRLRVVPADGRRGAGHARNAAVAATDAAEVAFCDADDRVAPGWLAAHRRALVDHEVSIGATVDVPPGQGISGGDVAWPTAVTRWGPFALVPGNNFAIRRATFEQLGGFDERFLTGQDVDLGIRAEKAGCRWTFTADARVLRTTRDGARSRFRRAVQYGRGHALIDEVHAEMHTTKDWWDTVARATPRLPVLAVSRPHREAWARRLGAAWGARIGPWNEADIR